jgi:hypothetical protein
MTMNTTIAPSLTVHPAPARPLLTRIWNVVRLHMVNRMVYLGIPWIIIAMAWAVTMVIALLINFSQGSGAGKALEGTAYSWAVISPLWYLVVVAVQTINLTFPFALGFSVTRRDFYLGTSVLFVIISIVNAIGLTILTAAEKATNGWGLGAHMFTALWFGHQSWQANLVIYFVMELGIFFIGACIATVFMRWRITGMLVFWISFAVLLIGLVSILTLTKSWPAVGAWLVAQGVLGVFAWLLVPVALAAIFGYLVLRKATPKN